MFMNRLKIKLAMNPKQKDFKQWMIKVDEDQPLKVDSQKQCTPKKKRK